MAITCGHMKFCFETHQSFERLGYHFGTVHNKSLNTDKVFLGSMDVQGNFSYTYTLRYTGANGGSMRTQKAMPYCTLSGRVVAKVDGCVVEGRVTWAWARVLILTAIMVVTAAVVLYVMRKDAQVQSFLVKFLSIAYILVVFSEYKRYRSSRKEALEEFRKLFMV